MKRYSIGEYICEVHSHQEIQGFNKVCPTRDMLLCTLSSIFPPEIQNHIPIEMNTHLETKIIQKHVYIIG
jgi:hypothetical protein